MKLYMAVEPGSEHEWTTEEGLSKFPIHEVFLFNKREDVTPEDCTVLEVEFTPVVSK